MSFGELAVVVIVGLIVMGPKELPKVLRKLGQWAGKLRRMAADLRAQSGIDDAIRSEGLTDDIREIQKLARGELDGVARSTAGALAAVTAPRAIGRSSAIASEPLAPEPLVDVFVDRDRETPREGADSYGAIPDTALVYADSFPKSPLARDPLYLFGDENAPLPPEEPPPEPAAPIDDAPALAEPAGENPNP
jgi:sec-independent protein translocase protein TatB